MKFTVSLIEVAPFLAAGGRPSEVLIKKHGRWSVVAGPIETGEINLSPVSGEAIHLELFPYRTLFDPALALAFAFQLGARLQAFASPVEIHLAVGTPLDSAVDEAGKPFFRIWLGAALTRQG